MRLAIIVSVAIATLAAAAVATAQGWPRWQARDGVAEIHNGRTTFGVTCLDGAPALMLTVPEDSGMSAEPRLLLQISNASDAYAIAPGNDIRTVFRTFSEADGGQYVSAAASGGDAELADVLERLRGGLLLTVGGDAFPRAERFTLIGSNSAIGAVLEGCGTS